MATADVIFYEGAAALETLEHGRQPMPLAGRMLDGTVRITYGTSSPLTPPSGARLAEITPNPSDGDGFVWVEGGSAALSATKYKPVYGANGSVFVELRNDDKIAHGASIPA